MRSLAVAALLAALAGADAFIGKNYCTEMTCTSGVNNIPNPRWKGNNGKTKYLGAFDTLKECESACLKYKNWKGKTCKSFAWYDPELGGCKGKRKCFDSLCYGLTSDSWEPVPQANVVSGKLGQGVAEAVNKAFSTVTSKVSSVEVPSISITGVFGGDDGGKSKKDDKKKAEESKRKEREAKEREEKEKKAAEEAKRQRERKQAEDARRAEEQRKEESRRKEKESKKSQEESKRQEESRRKEDAKRKEEARAAEEARKKKAAEEQKRADAARAKAEQEAKKKKKSKTNGSSNGGFLGMEGLDLLLSASATRMSISAAIVAILATYFGAKHAERSIKHKQLEEDLRSKGHIDDEGAWRL